MRAKFNNIFCVSFVEYKLNIKRSELKMGAKLNNETYSLYSHFSYTYLIVCVYANFILSSLSVLMSFFFVLGARYARLQVKAGLAYLLHSYTLRYKKYSPKHFEKSFFSLRDSKAKYELVLRESL